MRAAYPDHQGTVDRDGLDIHYEVYGGGDPSLVLIPPAPITQSRIFKGLIPYLSRHYRVVTFDGRGNGRSGRPAGPGSQSRAIRTADLLAVLDAADVEQALLVAHCHAGWWAVDAITAVPDRMMGLVAMAPEIPYLGTPHPHWAEAAKTWDEILEHPSGWSLYNRRVITSRLDRWVEFFFDAQLVEPHSTKQHEDAVEWALGSTGEILAASEEEQWADPPTREEIIAQLQAIGVPTLVIHGTEDVCQPISRGRAFAEVTGGELVEMEGSGHLPLVRDPVKVNRAITQFVDRITRKTMRNTVWTRGASRPERVLYLSSPIGLGHVRRDLAIAQELEKLRPEIQIDWLAQEPVTSVLRQAGQTIHPASEWLASESGHIASEAQGHELHCFQALRRMDEILVANFMVFQEVIEDRHYDLVVGDEAWDVDYYWHENPELKRGTHVWLTDFVGYLPMADGGEREALLTADYNAEMIEHIARFPGIRDRSVFVGNPDDIVPDVFGPDLPKIRDWTEEHFSFSGYITGFKPPSADDAAAWRSELGYGADEKVCVVTVGGSGVGRDLLEKAIAAYPLARETVPELRMVAVAGPRIDPDALPAHPGLEVRGYVEDLYRHLAVCDLAVVQGGLSTTMELTAAKRPFLYFPLLQHFEQNYHVRHRLDQYRAGRHMDYSATAPDALADAIAAEVCRPVEYHDVESDGAERAAAIIAELI